MPHQKSDPGWLSVTEVISLGIPKVNVSKKGKEYFYLEQWRGKIGNKLAEEISKESREIGILIHDQIERKFKSETIFIADSNIFRMYTNFQEKFVEPFNVKPIKLEQTYKSEFYKLQGTLDAEINTNKWDNVTADWKTSNQLDKIGGPLQLSMYDFLRSGDGKGVTVRLDKKTDKVEIVWYEDLRSYDSIWLAAMKTARYIKYGEGLNVKC